MRISARLSSGLAALALVATTAHLTGASGPAPAKTAKTIVRKAAGGFELTVDSIMRGLKLVGYPPAGLRWSVAPLPVENHGFEENTSWADEYKRILKLFEDNLKPHDTRRAS